MADIALFDEARWVKSLKQGDEAALGMVIDRYTPYVGAIVANVAGEALNREDQEEIIADSFYSLWSNAAKLRPGKLKAYLGTIARNKAKKALRNAGRELPLEDDLLVLSPCDPERELTRAEEAEFLRHCLDGLPEPDRTIFIRRYGLCQKSVEIARQMGLNDNTVRTKLRRSRERLCQILKEEGFSVE